jgi:hypothetical protein
VKVKLESTTKMVVCDGLYTRVWEGKTESGIEVHAFIVRLAAPLSANQAEFEKELQECRAPSPDVEAIPLRLIL